MNQNRLKLIDDIAFQLMRLSNRMVEVHNKPKDFGCGELLYPAEVHTLSTIYENPALSMTELAGILGVTKGAVSQMITRLDKKGLISKGFAPGSDKQRMLTLTKKGNVAYQGHLEHHRQMALIIEKRMSLLSIDDLKQYQHINSIIEELIEELH